MSKERDIARRIVRDQARYERPGVIAGARIGFRAMGKSLRAFRAGRDPVEAMAAEFEKAIPLLIDAMTVAHLGGLRNVGITLKLSSPYRKQIESLRRALHYTDEAIAAILATYGELAEEIISAIEVRTSRNIQAALLEIQQEGLHVREGAKRISDAFVVSGITPHNAYTLENVFRTEVQKAYSAGRWQFNEQPEIQEILVSYMYVTVGDDRVRPEHEGLDGVILPKGDPRWNEIFPPNGFSCRCQAIEVFDDREPVPPPAEFATTTPTGREITVKPGADRGFRVNFGKTLRPPIDVGGSTSAVLSSIPAS